MEQLRSYILSVSAAAVLCGIVTTLAGKNSTISALLKLMTGTVMAIVVIRPITEVSAVNLNRYLDILNADTAAIVEAGTQYTESKLQQRIKQQLEAYILAKAESLSLHIRVDVGLTADTMLPSSVVITGRVSPQARRIMETMLRDELGISLEMVTWK